MDEHKAVKILKASAGSGKTFSLTMHYIVLLFSGKNTHRKILAVTFTNKATTEMKQRILYVLSQLAEGSTDPFILKYESGIRSAYPDFSSADVQRKTKQIFVDILHDYGRFSISTIDKFVQQVVRGFSFELGHEAGYRIEMNTRKVIIALSEMLHQSLDDKPELLKWIIDFSRNQITSSKNWNYTKTLVSLAQQIFSESYWDFEQAIQSYGKRPVFNESFEKAHRVRADFEEQLHVYLNKIKVVWLESNVDESILAGKSRHYIPKIKNYHKRDIHRYIYEIDKFWKYIDDVEQWVPKKTSNELAITELYHQINPTLKAIYEHYNQHHGDYFLAVLLLTDLYYLRLMGEMNALLAEYRSDNRMLLISDANRLLDGITREHSENLSFIWEKTGIRYGHFLIDEFQDTSIKQWSNFLPLIQNAVAEWSGKLPHHLIVGDIKQSIYRWRNGDWRLLYQEAEKGIGSAFVQHDMLEENYRSAANIVEFNNVIFKYGPKWLQGVVNAAVLNEMGESFYRDFWVNTKHYDQIIEKAYVGAQQRVPPSSRNTGIIDIQILPVESNSHRPRQTRAEALQQTADRLYDWIEEKKWYQASQIGILVRRNQQAIDIINFLYQDLKKRANPQAYQVISGDALKLDTNDCVKLLINTLYLIVQPDLERDLYVMNCVQLYHQIHPEKRTELTPDVWLNVHESKQLLPIEVAQQHDKLAKLPLVEVVERLIDAYALGKKSSLTVKEHLPYLFAFRDAIANCADTGNSSIADFLKWWEEEHETLFLPGNDSGNVIQILTIHKSKGLAFDVVMLPFLDWTMGTFRANEDRVWANVENTDFSAFKNLPLNFGSKAIRHSKLAAAFYEEKLMRYMDSLNEVYVALTRAKKHLYIHAIDEQKPLSSFLSSDIIRYALKSYEADVGSAFDLQNAHQPVLNTVKGPASENYWQFSKYPQGDYLTQAFNKVTSPYIGGDAVDKRTRKGVLAHYVLSHVRKEEELNKVTAQMLLDGTIRSDELPVINELVLKVLHNPIWQQIIQPPYETINERSILDNKGATYRPDRVFIKADSAVVVDFKFTDIRTAEHIQQVKHYKELLSTMGFDSVKAYLFYGYASQLVEV